MYRAEWLPTGGWNEDCRPGSDECVSAVPATRQAHQAGASALKLSVTLGDGTGLTRTGSPRIARMRHGQTGSIGPPLGGRPPRSVES